tara:strand:- start:711 stop:1484 length:774 start_codon:yes stop_codon:yes gene_type:complete
MTNIRALVGAAAGLSTRATTGAVQFDGSTYLERGADLTGNTDNNFFSFSYWYRYDATDNGTGGTNIYESDNNKIKIVHTATGTAVEARTSPIAFTAVEGHFGTHLFHADTTKWHHACGNLDATSNTNTTFFIDDADEKNYAQDGGSGHDIDHTQPDHTIGAREGGTHKIEMSIYELWLAPGQDVRMSTTSNRRKFINADLTPVSLGSDGSTPTGTAPLIYMTGGPSEFVTNKGTGGNFSVSAGALIDVGPPVKANQE